MAVNKPMSLKLNMWLTWSWLVKTRVASCDRVHHVIRPRDLYLVCVLTVGTLELFRPPVWAFCWFWAFISWLFSNWIVLGDKLSGKLSDCPTPGTRPNPSVIAFDCPSLLSKTWLTSILSRLYFGSVIFFWFLVTPFLVTHYYSVNKSERQQQGLLTVYSWEYEDCLVTGSIRVTLLSLSHGLFLFLKIVITWKDRFV